MTLTDMQAYRNVIGCLMQNPLLLLDYTDIHQTDFDYKPARVCFLAVQKLYKEGMQTLTPIEIDQEINRMGGIGLQYYNNDGGLEFLKSSYEFAQLGNFDTCYMRMKKCALLRKLRQAKYDISEFYIEDKDVKDPKDVIKAQSHLDESSLEDILNSVEKNYSEIRNEFLHGGKLKGDPSQNIMELIEDLKKKPSVGPALEGKIFNTVCRGAREGAMFLKSSSTSGGKTRTSVFDACRLAYPKRWSHEKESFIEEVDKNGEIRPARKVLFIVTEMNLEEIQTIMLAYLSGVDEDHILTGKYDWGELRRVKTAARIMEEYNGYFLVEEIADPNLQNVEATIRRYVTVDEVKYVFFDYLHSTSSMIAQFSRNNVREDVILMMMANQLKQIAKDYGIFVFTATQVNALAMGDDEMAFKDEKSIRGAKSISDKADVGYVMTRVSEKGWNSLLPTLRMSVREGVIDEEILTNPPTHILDIYKMRRGRYKMIRIWTRIHLGTGERKDLFVTTADNRPFPEPIDVFSSASERPIII